MTVRALMFGSASALALAVGLTAGGASAQETTLTFIWHAGTCADAIVDIAKDYPNKSVKVVPALVPYGPEWHNKIASEFSIQGDAFDFAMWDSQSTAEFAGGGHAVLLNDVFDKSEYLKADLFPKASLSRYGEYPDDSGKYYGLPVNQDAYGLMYRKDLFEDPKEMAAFKAKYGYDLAVPKDYKQLRDIAEFFHRPDEKRYGVAIYTDNAYDALVMGYENTLFSYGGDLGDPKTFKVDGIINGKEAVESLELYRELYSFTPPGWGKSFFQEDNQAITEGLAAMSMNYFAFFPALVNPATNKYAKVTGFFANPAGPTGKQFAALGGQGISIVTYSQKQEEAMKFLAWFIREDVQKKWAELGGYTCAAKILESETFRQATPYNEAFYQSMFMVKDFWAVPEYAELLQQINARIYPFVVGGEGTAQAALDGVAKDWTATFAKYGRGG